MIAQRKFLTLTMFVLVTWMVGIVNAGVVVLGSSENGTLYDIDVKTGLASDPRETGLLHLRGLAHSPTGVTYAWQTVSGGLPGHIHTVDPDTGASSFLLPNPVNNGLDIAVEPNSNDLFVVSPHLGFAGTELAHIDLDTGATISSHNVPGVLAISFGPPDVLFMLTEESLQKFNVESREVIGEVALSQAVNGPFVGMTLGPDGVLYVSNTPMSDVNKLYALDPTSGELTMIGETGLGGGFAAGITNLTVIPGPASFFLLLLGAFAVMRRSRSVAP